MKRLAQLLHAKSNVTNSCTISVYWIAASGCENPPNAAPNLIRDYGLINDFVNGSSMYCICLLDLLVDVSSGN